MPCFLLRGAKQPAKARGERKPLCRSRSPLLPRALPTPLPAPLRARGRTLRAQ